MLRLSNFDYTLPKELIAQYPLEERDSAKLLVLDRKSGSIEHLVFKDLAEHLNKDDLIVLNDTKVLRARIFGSRATGGKAEVLLINRTRPLQARAGSSFHALLKPSRLKLGEKILFNGGNLCGTINSKDEITFNTKDIDTIYNLGCMPLPPYIKRGPQDSDSIYYQTVYAKEEGAIASPTAGLHFTKELIERIKLLGVNIGYITLHVGEATFRPVKCVDITEHKMEAEYFKVPGDTAGLIQEAKKKQRRIFAVGTTSLRTLETYAQGRSCGHTDLFIYPGYKFKMADCLLTNFHLPKTTLFMLVCAFAGRELIKKAYQEAIDRKYRFYSYGDAMLII